MDWNAIGAVGEVLGAAGVIATLLYLTIQLRQNTRATQAQTVAGVHDSIGSYLLASSQSSELASLWAKADSSGLEALEANEEFQLRGFLAALFYSFLNAHDQMRIGTISEEQWLPYRNTLSGLLSQRPNREFWEQYRTFLPESFNAEIESLLN